MTDLRQAAQQALEALEELDGLDTETECVTIDVGDVIAALRTALEQQAEPVAWMDRDGDVYPMPENKKWAPPHVLLYTTPPQQQAEPPPEWESIKNILDEYGLDAIAFVKAWKAVQQQAEPVAWDKTSASFNAWWDSYRHDPANPFAEESAAYWAWAGWKSAQRQWVGLTDEDVNRESAPIARQMKLAFHAGMYVAQQILKERNNG
jgi:hypothetical protein